MRNTRAWAASRSVDRIGRSVYSLDDTRFSVAFDVGKLHFLRSSDAFPAQIFHQISLRIVIPSLCVLLDFAVFDHQVTRPFYEAADRMKAASQKGQGSVQQHQNEPATNGCHESRRAIDRTRHHRREDETEHRVQGTLLRQKPFIPYPDE